MRRMIENWQNNNNNNSYHDNNLNNTTHNKVYASVILKVILM